MNPDNEAGRIAPTPPAADAQGSAIRCQVQDLRLRYQHDGFVFPLEAIDRGEAQRILQLFEAQQLRARGKSRGRSRQRPHLLFTWIDALVRHPRILDAVEAVLGPDLLCWNSGFFIKAPHDERFVSWHQDAAFFGLSEPRLCTAWIALSPATAESGCMQMLPGSHHLSRPHVQTFASNNMLSRGQTLADPIDPRHARPVLLEPGQFSLHHGLTAHRSEPNHSALSRVGLAIRYIAPEVRQTLSRRDTAVLVRGRDRHAHFELLDPPDADLSPRAVQRHRHALKLAQDILYTGLTARAGRARPEDGRTPAGSAGRSFADPGTS
ncbi:MAG: phytanoyl-CoA dioxygenase family protein [Gammaproteobacteria bacterium]|nr:phytanoyl-CoA dioxygenase family protein [Gammaproteobacteria bacterium]